ncbi:uncharacterized protein [Dermacentor albipictus]|uniref:uncharacterized protein n=1 Tax=Dermacentor albipictus TaxID=60249 RepID=UPI0038FBEB09
MERGAIRTGKVEHWTEYRRADARCRRQARRRRSLCSAIEGRSRGPLAWRLLKSLTSRRGSLQPVLAVAITLSISEEALAELLANQFALAVPRTAAILKVGQPSVSLPSCLHNHHTGSSLL